MAPSVQKNNFDAFCRDAEGGFSAQLVIQHHDKVVTNSDIGQTSKHLGI